MAPAGPVDRLRRVSDPGSEETLMESDEPIDFWFSIGSTYTYLTVMRLARVEQDSGVSFRWRPFSVRAIMREMDNVPFATKPAKAKYMWRDIERRAAWYGFPARVPAPYPLKEFDVANRVAILGAAEGWCPQYVRATYRRWLQGGLAPGDEPNLSDSLREIGQNPARVLSLAATDAITRAYDDETDAARAVGVFGAPSFVVGQELFWGDDRLEDAISWREREMRGTGQRQV
jgi:2-hydroxychromene-2-carboxylate isomerase